MTRLWDISPVLSEDSIVFSEDVPFSQNFSRHVDRDDHLTISSITSTVHIEAHADAPVHYLKGGEGIDERDLRLYLGACQVIKTEVQGRGIAIEDIAATDIVAPRVLFSSGPNKSWNDDFTWLDGALIGYLFDKGVRLVGIDTPSVDSATSQSLDTHHEIASRDMAILEGLDLNDVPAGIFTLIALPLKIKHGDASPVRAILLERGDSLE